MGRRHEDDDGDGGDESPRRRGARLGLAVALSALTLACWGLLLAAVAVGGVTFVAALGKATTAPQEAALGAVFSTGFVALYVGVRCVEKIAAAVERLTAPNCRECRTVR